jgi:hypothetical protein
MDNTGTVSLTGDDNVIINNGANRVMKDFGDGAIVEINFPDKLVEAKVGKNGNVIFAFKASGKKVEVKMRVLAGSADDKFLNQELKKYLNDKPSYVLLQSNFVKRVGDGKGKTTSITYELGNGLIDGYPKASESVEGDSEQAIAEYSLIFSNTDRKIS